MGIQIFGNGFILMIVCIAAGILLAFVGGTVIDTMTMGKTGEPFVNNSDIPTEWKNSQDATMWWFINLYYFICYALPVLGVAIFIQSILPKTSGDKYL
jgi:ABC-type amino acid transport system permease subunit